MESIQVYKHKTNPNKILKIFYDENTESPRDWDNLGTIFAKHRRYTLGDKDANEEDLEQAMKNGLAIPIFAYEHGGIALSCSNNSYPFNDRWDSGQLGYIYVSREKLLKEYSQKRLSKKTLEKAKRVLIGEIETYSQYLNGEVYGFIEYDLVNCDHGDTHEDHTDSCWGYYDIKDILAEKGQDWELK